MISVCVFILSMCLVCVLSGCAFCMYFVFVCVFIVFVCVLSVCVCACVCLVCVFVCFVRAL